ncbi:uncharacterized protein DUF929 [Motilibacter peucedani]|uniref:Uncharacterized protein DUF929 n=1 Tax=Motilibacter peucedani TaxID=598650 RepID=A0A420XVD2_9ACTN|nr:DUF929 family protein [Motilibacter peucedani]RKS84247.1 uncharacterized protein DUF929 [Motilibacter peucedani]
MPAARKTPTDRRAAARAKAEQLRLQQARSERRRRVLLAGSSVAVVVALVVALVAIRLASGGSSDESGAASQPADPAVVAAVTGVPATAYAAVGTGTVTAQPTPLSGQPALTADGKPRVLYLGAEYCPFCAAERWGVVAALSRFGTFSGLAQTHSSPSDVFPSTPTLSFHGATYTSDYISFTGQELESNEREGNGYAPLDTAAPADLALLRSVGKGAYPFLDIGGRYAVSGASYDAQVLQGKTHAQVAQALSDPTSEIAKGVLGTANSITAAVCTLTGQQPAAVCSAAGVTKAAAALSPQNG